MENQVTKEEYNLRALESQYIDDLRVKNRRIAELQTTIQLLTQQVRELQRDALPVEDSEDNSDEE